MLQEAGHSAEKIFARDKKIGFCNACYACRENSVCALKDGMQNVLEDGVGGCARHGESGLFLLN